MWQTVFLFDKSSHLTLVGKLMWRHLSWYFRRRAYLAHNIAAHLFFFSMRDQIRNEQCSAEVLLFTSSLWLSTTEAVWEQDSVLAFVSSCANVRASKDLPPAQIPRQEAPLLAANISSVADQNWWFNMRKCQRVSAGLVTLPPSTPEVVSKTCFTVTTGNTKEFYLRGAIPPNSFDQ